MARINFWCKIRETWRSTSNEVRSKRKIGTTLWDEWLALDALLISIHWGGRKIWLSFLPSVLSFFFILFALVCNMHHMSPGKLTMIRRNHVRQLSKRDFCWCRYKLYTRKSYLIWRLTLFSMHDFLIFLYGCIFFKILSIIFNLNFRVIMLKTTFSSYHNFANFIKFLLTPKSLQFFFLKKKKKWGVFWKFW